MSQKRLGEIPATIEILGVEFKVKVVKLKGVYGDCDTDKRVIRLDSSLSKSDRERTLFHEAIHAALRVSGFAELLSDEKQEEALTVMLENAFSRAIDVEKLGS